MDMNERFSDKVRKKVENVGSDKRIFDHARALATEFSDRYTALGANPERALRLAALRIAEHLMDYYHLGQPEQRKATMEAVVKDVEDLIIRKLIDGQ